MRLMMVIIGCVFMSTFALSATVYIPDDYSTFVDAIAAAQAGDTIIVRPGTYYEEINFQGKAITIKSEYGPSVTTIDRYQWGRVVIFDNSEGPDSTLEGFTLTNGVVSGYGGGILCHLSSPTIRNNIITDNYATEGGGGMMCYDSYPVITNNTISLNTSDTFGGGIECLKGSPTILNNKISSNSATRYGGGIYIENSSPLLEKNQLSANSANYGGGINVYDSGTPTIIDNYITGNVASRFGGGIAIGSGATPIFYRNFIDSNTADIGGGIWCNDSAVPLFNLVIVNNTASDSGGAIYCASPISQISNITAWNNSASKGGAIFCYKTDTTLVNSILWNNSSNMGKEIYIDSNSSITITDTDIDGWIDSLYVETGGNPIWGTGNIDSDPLFVEPTNGDFHISLPSPCRNSGNNSVVLDSVDFEGDPRIADNEVDMGADEFYAHLYYEGEVIPGATGEVKIIGHSPSKTLLAMSGLQDPPSNLPYGDLWLTLPLAQEWSLGQIPSTGVYILPVTIPTTWVSGEPHYFQALVGKLGYYNTTKLTNLLTLTAE